MPTLPWDWKRIFLILAILLIPLNGFPGPAALRELSVEASVYPISIYILLNINGIVSVITKKFLIFILVAMVIALNYLINYDTISQHIKGNISGADKFITSLFVFSFYFSFSVAVYSHLRAKSHAYVGRIIRIVAIILSPALICVWSIETVSWYIPSLRNLIEPIRRTVSIGPYFSIGRIYGVSYEPSFNAIVMVGLLPFLAYLYFDQDRPRVARIRTFAVMFVFFIFCALSDSRTAYLALLSQLAIILLFGTSSNGPRRSTVIILTLCFVVFPVIVLHAIAVDLDSIDIASQSVSNITRLSSIHAALMIWHDNLWFGSGFGQFGFLYPAYIPSVGVASWEVMDYLYNSRWHHFAPSYSLFGRILAETGVSGYLIFSLLVVLVVRMLPPSIAESGARSFFPLTLFCVLGICGSLTVGLSFDSYRQAFLWLFLGVTAAAGGIRSCSSTPCKSNPIEEKVPGRNSYV